MKDRHEEYERKQRNKRILGVIVVTIIIIFLLFFVRLTFTEHTIDKSQVPINRTMTYVSQDQVTEQTCIDRKYNWNYTWEGWAPDVKDMTSPNYRLYNLEGKSGQFTVRFLFFDTKRVAFVAYEGKDYNAIKSQLPESSASMISENFTFTLDANSDKVVNIYTKKAQQNASYWVYADVHVPLLHECSQISSQPSKLLNKTFTDYQTVQSSKDENITVRLIDYIIYLFTGK